MSLRIPTGTITAKIMGGVSRIGTLLGLLVSATGAIMDRREPLAGAAGYYATATHGDAAITLAAVAGKRNVISGVCFSYSGAAAAGTLKIEDVSGTVVFSVDYTSPSTSGLPMTINFAQPLMNAVNNTALIVTLTDGGAGAVGKVNLLGVWTESAAS